MGKMKSRTIHLKYFAIQKMFFSAATEKVIDLKMVNIDYTQNNKLSYLLYYVSCIKKLTKYLFEYKMMYIGHN